MYKLKFCHSKFCVLWPYHKVLSWLLSSSYPVRKSKGLLKHFAELRWFRGRKRDTCSLICVYFGQLFTHISVQTPMLGVCSLLPVPWELWFMIKYNYMECNLCSLFSCKNIKKLLKIPYSKSHVSMAVHRIGRTLLLDELDIQELFMRSSQVSICVVLSMPYGQNGLFWE